MFAAIVSRKLCNDGPLEAGAGDGGQRLERASTGRLPGLSTSSSGAGRDVALPHHRVQRAMSM